MPSRLRLTEETSWHSHGLLGLNAIPARKRRIQGENMKHIKTLGLLAIAAMALTAFVGVSSASAATKFTSSKVGAAISEATLATHVFTVTGSQTKCTNITYTGSTEALESATQKVTPKYEGCTAFGLPATVTVKNCLYNLAASGSAAMEKVNAEGEACEIVIKASNIFGECLVDVPAQTVNGLTFTNDGASALTVNINASGISDNVTKSTGVCPLTAGKHSNATYTGESTVTASGANIQVD